MSAGGANKSCLARKCKKSGIYDVALERLDVTVGQALAIEDSAASMRSAKAAGAFTIAVPGEFTCGQEFGEADFTPDSLQGFAQSEVG